MIVPGGIAVGVSTHTGLVRAGNEDDFLLVSVPESAGGGFVAAIADGMGGVAGGAEASRTALRALGSALLEADAGADPLERLRRGFATANARVVEASQTVPALRDMGTTLTALWIRADGAASGHVGDSRLYLVRGGTLERLTTDHVLREGESLLTRCIGAGQSDCEADEARHDVRAGDRFVLVTDGVWNAVPGAAFARAARRADPQHAAAALVQAALDGGGPDNATAVVVDVRDPSSAGRAVEVELPRGERPGPRAAWPAAVSLRPSAWPAVLLVAASLALAWAGLRWFGVDAAPWLG